MATYLVADLVDRHWFLFLEPFLGPEPQWQNYVEECMESFGHLLMFVFSIAVLRLGSIFHGRDSRG